MDPIIAEFKSSSQKSLDYLKEDFKSIRTGKANPGLIENIMVQTYGGQSNLKIMELGTTVSENSSTLSFTPYDQSIVTDVEKSLLKSPLGLSPAVQGNRIVIRLPPLSQEQREKFSKLVGQKSEERKNIIRGFRDEARRRLKQRFETKEVTEDEKFRIEKELDNQSQKFMDDLQKIRDNKEKEIREI